MSDSPNFIGNAYTLTGQVKNSDSEAREHEEKLFAKRITEIPSNLQMWADYDTRTDGQPIYLGFAPRGPMRKETSVTSNTSKEIAFWLLIFLLISCVMSISVARAEEPATNADVYAMLYENKSDIPFSMNSVTKSSIPPFVKRGEIRCDGFKEESVTQGGAVVTTCIEIPPSARYPIIEGAAA